jgi:hypothetical protein
MPMHNLRFASSRTPSLPAWKLLLTKTVRIILYFVIASSAGLNLGNRSWADDAVDENRAIELVFKSPKVGMFLRKMKASKQPVGAMTERKSKCVFNVRVFEDRPDHIATFGFYDADICRGNVTVSN